MPNRRIEVFSRREFDFGGLQAASAEVIMIKHIDLGDVSEASLFVRAHSATIDDAGSNIEVIAEATAPTREEPGTDWVDSSSLTTARVANTTTAPALVEADFASTFPGSCQIKVKGTYSGTNDCKAELSAEIVAKE